MLTVNLQALRKAKRATMDAFLHGGDVSQLRIVDLGTLHVLDASKLTTSVAAGTTCDSRDGHPAGGLAGDGKKFHALVMPASVHSANSPGGGTVFCLLFAVWGLPPFQESHLSELTRCIAASKSHQRKQAKPVASSYLMPARNHF